MANVDKKIIRNYNLQLNEEEYYAILTLIGMTPYETFKDLVNQRYSFQVGRQEVDVFDIISLAEWSELYEHLNNSK